METPTLNSKTSQMSALSHAPMPAWTGIKGSCFGLFARDEPDEAASHLQLSCVPTWEDLKQFCIRGKDNEIMAFALIL